MANIIIRPGWYLPEGQATSESAFLDRRRLIKAMGAAGVGLMVGGSGTVGLAAPAGPARTQPAVPLADHYPAPRNPAYKVAGRLTPEKVAARYNNFYEFTLKKDRVWKRVDKFKPYPWQVEIAGEVAQTGVFALEDLIGKIPLEERVYRFRCVEAWAMDLPWTGIPLRKLIERLGPTSNAKYVAFATFLRPDEAPGQADPRNRWLGWPYIEALSLAEATHELTLLATGIYGHPLPKQHGAPVRLVVPWKYGYKSIKSIVKIAFLPQRPPTTWNRAMPREYSFHGNVDPNVPHPRWSQKTERMIDTRKRRKTLRYNGYASHVADLYKAS